MIRTLYNGPARRLGRCRADRVKLGDLWVSRPFYGVVAKLESLYGRSISVTLVDDLHPRQVFHASFIVPADRVVFVRRLV